MIRVSFEGNDGVFVVPVIHLIQSRLEAGFLHFRTRSLHEFIVRGLRGLGIPLGFLQLCHVVARAVFCQLGPCDGILFIFGIRCLRGNRRRRCPFLHRVFTEQNLIGGFSRHAVSFQSVIRLEFFERVRGIPAELPVNGMLEIAQIFQPLLQCFDVGAFGSVLQGLLRHRHSGRGCRLLSHLRRRCGVSSDCICGINRFLGFFPCRTVCLQAVLFLEGAYRADGVRIIGACRRILIVAQFFQSLLQRRDLGAFVAFFHGNAFHRAQGSDIGFVPACALR